MPETFKCACCKRTFTKARTDEEAMAEAREEWGEVLGDAPEVVCDSCWPTMMKLPASPAEAPILIGHLDAGEAVTKGKVAEMLDRFVADNFAETAEASGGSGANPLKSNGAAAGI